MGESGEVSSRISRLPAAIGQKIVQLWRILISNPHLLLLFAAIFIYGVVFSYFTILKHDAFHSYAWDLGIFNQAMYSTVHDGRLFYYTVELYLSQTGSYFAVHFSPILFLLLPFYAVYPQPATLLVIQSFALALGAVPLYLLARRLLGSDKTALVLGIAYLLYPALQGANWFDFHTPALLPLFFFFSCYFMVTHRWKLYFPFVLLTLMIQEQVVYPVVIIAAYYFLKSGHVKSLFKLSRPLRMTENLASAATLLMSALYYVFVVYVKGFFPINPSYTEVIKASSAFEILGLKGDPILLPLSVISNPQNAVNALMHDFALKVLYIVLMFGTLLFVSFRSKLAIGAIGLMSLYLFSNYPGYYEIGNQYPLYVLPLIFVAAVYGLRKLQMRNTKPNFKAMIVVPLLFIVVVSPLSPLSTPLAEEGAVWYPIESLKPVKNAGSLKDLLNFIPTNASILTQNHIFPHVSSRINAYTFPLSNLSNDTDYLRFLIDSSEYILFDMATDDQARDVVMDMITQNNSYGAYAMGNDSFLFQRGFQGEPILVYTPVFSVQKGLYVAYGQVMNDSSSQSGEVAVSRKGLDQGIVTYGPYISLPSGNFSAVFRVKTFGTARNAIVNFDVSSGIGTEIITHMELNSTQISDGSWFNFTLPFSLNSYTSQIEFRTSSNGLTNLYVDTITLQGAHNAADD